MGLLGSRYGIWTITVRAAERGRPSGIDRISSCRSEGGPDEAGGRPTGAWPDSGRNHCPRRGRSTPQTDSYQFSNEIIAASITHASTPIDYPDIRIKRRWVGDDDEFVLSGRLHVRFLTISHMNIKIGHVSGGGVCYHTEC